MSITINHYNSDKAIKFMVITSEDDGFMQEPDKISIMIQNQEHNHIRLEEIHELELRNTEFIYLSRQQAEELMCKIDEALQ